MTPPRLRKRLGQHHLTRPELCQPLVEFLQPAGHRVVEIGPGGGVLTAMLRQAGATVRAVELDGAWAFALRRRLGRDRLEVVAGDAMDLVWERLRRPTLVAGNLPYQIATALIERLLPLSSSVPRAGFLVQREVGERLAAAPGDAAYGSLSVLVAACAEVEILARVRRSAFRPPPKVEGLFVGLHLRPPPPLEGGWTAFRRTVRLAFGLRRKTLRNALAAGWGREAADAAVQALDQGPLIRAQDLELESFLRLHEYRPGPSSAAKSFS